MGTCARDSVTKTLSICHWCHRKMLKYIKADFNFTKKKEYLLHFCVIFPKTCLHAACVDQSRQNIYRLTTVEERKNPTSNQTCFCCQQQISCVQGKRFNAKKHGICSTSQSFLQHVACPVRWAGYLFLFLSLQIRQGKNMLVCHKQLGIMQQT